MSWANDEGRNGPDRSTDGNEALLLAERRALLDPTLAGWIARVARGPRHFCGPTGWAHAERVPSEIRMNARASWRDVVELDGWRLLILVADDYSLTTDFELVDPTGIRYLGSAGTPEMVRRLIDTNSVEVPFWMSDLILLDELSRDRLIAAVRLLIERGEVARALDRADPDTDTDLDEPDGPP